MAVIINTSTPNKVLSTLKTAIDEGKIQTWTYDKDGDFTHTPEQWARQAWMRPIVSPGQLLFRILRPEGKKVSIAAYAVYHGRLIEMVLRHADSLVTEAKATSQPEYGDLV